MNILVIGSGGREHALCWAMKKSPNVTSLFCAPGNAGIAEVAECVSVNGQEAIATFCAENAIALVVIGPEQPLVDGVSDYLRARNITVFGPSQAAAQLEGSKAFTKDICDRYNIPTAAYAQFDEAAPAIAYVKTHGAPIVVKADGLAAGKGVTVAQSEAEAITAIEACFDGRFGEAGASLVIEDFLEGEEVSFFALSDGETAIELASAQDHKAAYDGDTGPNTGGMGTYSPAPIMSESLRAEVMKTIIMPLVKGMKADGTPYQGVIFAGLMITRKGAELIEINCRFGDPEAQVILPRMQGDVADMLLCAAEGRLGDIDITLSPQAALCVVMAAEGYPNAYEKGTIIEGVEAVNALENITVFHAGTRRGRNCGKLKANGGRVLGVTALGNSVADAQSRAYNAVAQIDWKEGFCRSDIGWRAVQREKAA